MPRHSSAASSTSTRRRLTFSFDSSGWLYAYHLGAAHYIQTQCMPQLSEDELAFSGSSGGALVACALCTGISIAELACYVIDQQPECKFNPWRMLPCAEAAVDRFLPERAAEMAATASSAVQQLARREAEVQAERDADTRDASPRLQARGCKIRVCWL